MAVKTKVSMPTIFGASEIMDLNRIRDKHGDLIEKTFMIRSLGNQITKEKLLESY